MTAVFRRSQSAATNGKIASRTIRSRKFLLGLRAGELGRIAHSQFSEERRSRRGMETAAEVRSVSGRSKWRNHRHVARLPLQLDRGLSFDEKRRRGPSAVHSNRRIFDQTDAADAYKWPNLAFRTRCRSKRKSRDD